MKETNTDKPAIRYPIQLEELNTLERNMLEYCAFTAKPMGDRNIPVFARLAGCSERDAKAARKSLQDRCMLEKRKPSYYENTSIFIVLMWQAFAICYLLQNDPAWHGVLKRVGISGGDFGEITENVSQALDKLLRGKRTSINTLYPWNSKRQYAAILTPMARQEVMVPLLVNLDEEVLSIIVQTVIQNDMMMGWQDSVGFVKRLYDGNPSLAATMPQFMSKAQWAFYLAHGQLCQDEDVMRVTPAMVKSQVEGFRQAYRGNMEQAMQLFDESLKLGNRTAKPSAKNMFDDPIAQFLLLTSYAKEGSQASIKKIDTATRKKTLAEEPQFAPCKHLANYFKDEYRQVEPYMLKFLLRTSDMPKGMPSSVSEQLTYLFVRYADVNKKDLNQTYREVDLDAQSYLPQLALLRHELSPYLSLDEAELVRLREMFGGDPLLCSIHRKALWELLLESMLPAQSAPEDTGETAKDAKTERIVYIFDREKPYYDESIELEVKVQTRLKSGAWGVGKKLSYAAYQDGSFEMDEVDRVIWQNNQGSYYGPSLEAALPHLAGVEDKLFFNGRGYDREPVKVVEVKPFLVVKRSGSHIVVDSNLPAKVSLDQPTIYHFDTKSMAISYFPLTQQQRKCFLQFRQLGQMPLEAEELLKRVFPAIRETVEIHSDFIEGGSQLKEADGQQRVCLRVVPVGSEFNLSVSVTPLEGGRQTFAPGEGGRLIYDERDGERYQVKRSLSSETANGRLFVDFLDTLGVDASGWSAQLMPEDLLELLDFAHEHPVEGYMEWPEGERMRLKVADSSAWNVSLKKNGGWFDLEGEVPVDEHTVLSVGQLLELMQGTRSRFVKIGEEQYLSLSESLRKQLVKLEALASTSRGKASIPAVGMALMGEALNGEMQIRHTKEVDELAGRIRKSAKLRPEVPEALNATLRDYQVDGYRWMSRLDSWGAGACLADDMGLGKTVQTIAFLLDKSADGPALVVAPASVVPNWQKELARFAPTLRCRILNEADDRSACLKDAVAGDVILSTYGLLVTQQESLVEKEWATVCLDEAHTIKNRGTKSSAVCMKLKSVHRLILTGTPIQNHLGELWNLFQFINPGLLGSYENFSSKFITPIEGYGDDDRRQQLKRIIAPFMLRRTKKEVVAELPDKQDVTLSVELSKEEMAAYEVLRRKAQADLEEIQLQGSRLDVNALAEITRLRMCSCSVALVEKGWPGQSSKIESFLELAQEIVDGGNRVLVFSQFTSFLEMVKQALDQSEDFRNVKYFYLDGSTPMRQRTKMVDAFQKGECQLFLISLKAGGLGLNLTGANYVIHLDPWWNPAIEQQATDRAHRIGQEQKVTVYHLVAQHTIEEKILRLHETKRDLATSLLEGTNQSHKISADELLKLITE